MYETNEFLPIDLGELAWIYANDARQRDEQIKQE